jgi:HEAT repeat protein
MSEHDEEGKNSSPSGNDEGTIVSSGDGSLAAGRDAINNRIANIDNELNNVQINAPLTINNTINLPSDSGAQSIKVRRDEFLNACEQVTRSSLADKSAKHPVIKRNIERKIEQFLTSSVRYCFVLGPSGVGKSILMANETERLRSLGWTVLLLHGGSFSMQGLAETISYKLPEQTDQLTPFQVVKLLTEESRLNPSGFILFIDGIDEADPYSIAQELERLHTALSGTTNERLKIILSCRDIIWERLRYTRLLSLYEPVDEASAGHGRAFQTVRVADFTVEELNQALQIIGDQTLLAPGRYGDAVDPHVATLRDLLRHPGTFEHYARLLVTGSISQVLLSEGLTWSKLISLRFNDDLGRVAVQCGKTREEISRLLTRLGVAAWQQKSYDFKVDVETVRTNIPELRVDNLDPHDSPFASLQDNGVLRKFNDTSDTVTTVGFDVSDAGAYFLSYDLERVLRETQGLAGELKDVVKSWLDQAWNYSPLLDAVLALLDRLIDAQDNRRLKIVLRTILENRHMASRGIFYLVNPNVISTIFEMLKESDRDVVYTCREAAVEIRPSTSMLEIVRRHLSDENTHARQLAAKLVGVHRDKESIQDLIDMLDDDKDVRREVYKSFGQIGKDAIQALLDSLNAISTSGEEDSERRSRYLVALRDIGIRVDGISGVLRRCLEDGLNGNDELLKSALLTVLHLRDTKQTVFVLKALHHPDHMIALIAANILEEFPDPSAFEEILASLRSRRSPDGQFIERYTIPLHLMKALIGADRVKAEPIILEFIIDGLNETGELSPSEAVKAAITMGIRSSFPDILENLVSKLRASSQRNGVGSIIRKLSGIWVPDQLKALVEAAHSLELRGINIAQVFADALIPGMEVEGEFTLADRLNLTSEYHPVVKSQAAGVVPEAGRLLQHATEFNVSDLCELLWVAADERSEADLIKKLANTRANNDVARLERESVIRALGTCGTEQGAAEVLNYIRTEEYELSISRETLWPLAIRQQLPASELVNIVEDSEQLAYVRTTCLEVLSMLGAEHFEDTFLKISDDDTNDLLQATAVSGFDQVKSQRVSGILNRLIRTSKHTIVRAYAAEILSLRDERRSIRYIERALESDPGVFAHNFAEALARFQDPTSISPMVRALQQSPEQFRSAYIEALCSFWQFREGRQAVIEQFEKWSERRLSFFNEQSPLIMGMARQDANFLLEQVKKHYDDGYLNNGALETLALQIPTLFRSEGLDEQLLLEVLERVLCDPHVASREKAAAALGRIEPHFCHKLYEFLWNTEEYDEKRRACAIYSLGFWDGDEELIKSARFAEEWLVRRAADSAFEHRRKRKSLQEHIEGFLSTNNLTRLSAYLIIKAHGDQNTIRAIYSALPGDSILRVFGGYLRDYINERLRKNYQEMERSEREALEHRGSVSLG